MEWRGDKWRTLSLSPKQAVICLFVAVTCFCVPGDFDKLTGRACRRQRSKWLSAVSHPFF